MSFNVFTSDILARHSRKSTLVTAIFQSGELVRARPWFKSQCLLGKRSKAGTGKHTEGNRTAGSRNKRARGMRWRWSEAGQTMAVSQFFEGESFRETLFTSSAVLKCDGRAFGTFPGCVTRCFTLTSWFLPIYATRCRVRVCILQRSNRRPITSQRHVKPVPVWSSSRCSFSSLFLEDAPLRSFTASQDSLTKEREKKATSRGVVRHFRG